MLQGNSRWVDEAKMKELWPRLQQLLPHLKLRLRASARRRLAVGMSPTISRMDAGIIAIF